MSKRSPTGQEPRVYVKEKRVGPGVKKMTITVKGFAVGDVTCKMSLDEKMSGEKMSLDEFAREIERVQSEERKTCFEALIDLLWTTTLLPFPRYNMVWVVKCNDGLCVSVIRHDCESGLSHVQDMTEYRKVDMDTYKCSNGVVKFELHDDTLTQDEVDAASAKLVSEEIGRILGALQSA